MNIKVYAYRDCPKQEEFTHYFIDINHPCLICLKRSIEDFRDPRVEELYKILTYKQSFDKLISEE